MYKVLIVEDDPMVAMINEQYIKRNKNFEIVGNCNNGLSALDFIENNTVDLLILDVFMPKMDGFETRERKKWKRKNNMEQRTIKRRLIISRWVLKFFQNKITKICEESF